MGRLRRGDLRGGRARLPRAADHDRGVRRARAATRRTRSCAARRERRGCRTGARACRACLARARAPAALAPGRDCGAGSGRAAATLRRCACSSPAGPGSSARTSCGGSPTGGDEVVVLDKLTYAGNPANLDGVDARVRPGRHRRPGRGRPRRPPAATRSSTSPPRRTSTARSSAPRSSSTPTCSARCACSSGRATHDARLVQVSTDEVYGDLEAGGSRARGRPAAAVEPVQRRRRPAATCRCSRTSARTACDASITRGANTYGPNQYPGEARSRSSSRTRSTASRCRSTATASRCASGSTSTTTAPAIELVLREGAAGEVYNVGGEEHENIEVTHRILELTGADPSLVRHVEDRAGHDRRYSLDDTKLRALGWAPEHSLRRGRPAETVDWYREQPRLVGADQVRRVPRVLRGAVRRPLHG